MNPTHEEYDGLLDEYLSHREEMLVEKWVEETFAEKKLRHAERLGIVIAYAISAALMLIVALAFYRLLVWLWP